MPLKPRIFLVLMIPFLLGSCTGWPRGWLRAKQTAPADALSGAWEGRWRSEPTGHSGKLRCVVLPKSPGLWEYRYRASWAKVLCAGFRVECQAEKQPDGTWMVRGERDLGKLFGGIFTHSGKVSGDHMAARYEARADQGILVLRRVAAPR